MGCSILEIDVKDNLSCFKKRSKMRKIELEVQFMYLKFNK